MVEISSSGDEILFLIVAIECFVVTLLFGSGVDISAGFGARLVVKALPRVEVIFAESLMYSRGYTDRYLLGASEAVVNIALECGG